MEREVPALGLRAARPGHDTRQNPGDPWRAASGGFSRRTLGSTQAGRCDGLSRDPGRARRCALRCLRREAGRDHCVLEQRGTAPDRVLAGRCDRSSVPRGDGEPEPAGDLGGVRAGMPRAAGLAGREPAPCVRHPGARRHGGAQAPLDHSDARGGLGQRASASPPSCATCAPWTVDTVSRDAPCGKRVRGPSQRSQEGTRRRRLARRSRTAGCRSCAGWRKGPEQIADELGISVHALPNHVRNARRKLGARSRLDAVVTAMRQGVLESPRERTSG